MMELTGDPQANNMQMHYLLEDTRIEFITVRLYMVGSCGYEVVTLQDVYRELPARQVFPEATMEGAIERKVWLCKMARAMVLKLNTKELDALEAKGLILPEFRHDRDGDEQPQSIADFMRMMESIQIRKRVTGGIAVRQQLRRRTRRVNPLPTACN